jgi:hypothetical protein
MQNDPNIYLLIAGIVSALIAILHFFLTVKPSLYRYMNAEELVKIHEKGSPITRLLTLGLMLVFIAWSLYAFSGAGLIPELPLLKFCLISISVIYFLRGLLLPMELYKVFLSSYPKRFIFFSMISLLAGLLYLLGVIEL